MISPGAKKNKYNINPASVIQEYLEGHQLLAQTKWAALSVPFEHNVFATKRHWLNDDGLIIVYCGIPKECNGSVGSTSKQVPFRSGFPDDPNHGARVLLAL